MDAPPPAEDCLPFVRVAGFLESMQLNAPRLLEADMEQGFLLLTDLGTREYLGHLQSAPGDSASLYDDAIKALLKMQHSGAAFQALLPPYDEKLLRFELSLFWDWLCGTHLDLALSDSDEQAWRRCCDLLVDNALSQPQVFVHRDYHSRNLMLTAKDNPGILDFQDAVEGPFTYDLVSLLKDCYIALPPADVRQLAFAYYRALGDATHELVDELQFWRYFELMGVQRHLKAAGIFCRLNHRDGKSLYLADVPRTLSYILATAPRYEELDFIASLLTTRVLPAWEASL